MVKLHLGFDSYEVEESDSPSEIQITIVPESVLSNLQGNEMILTRDKPTEAFNPANVYFLERGQYHNYNHQRFGHMTERQTISPNKTVFTFEEGPPLSIYLGNYYIFSFEQAGGRFNKAKSKKKRYHKMSKSKSQKSKRSKSKKNIK